MAADLAEMLPTVTFGLARCYSRKFKPGMRLFVSKSPINELNQKLKSERFEPPTVRSKIVNFVRNACAIGGLGHRGDGVRDHSR